MSSFVFQGFTVLELKSIPESKYSHQLFVKQHSVRDSDATKPSDQTLFIVNLPPYVQKENLIHMFQKFGKVTEVFLQKEPKLKESSDPLHNFFNPQKSLNTFKFGYVVFASSKTLKQVIALPSSTVLTLSSSEEPLLTGKDKWSKEYNDSFIPIKLIRETAEKIIEDYDLKKQKEKEAMNTEPDEEGWITVSTKNKRKHSEPERGNQNRNKKRRRKKTKLLNFYAFQNKEAKLEHLAEHRKKFEEDRKRLQMMKSARKFKPL